MYNIIFYEDIHGKSPVKDYLVELRNSNTKEDRIKLNKINDYIQALSVYGVIGLNGAYVKHIEDNIWELRPSKERIIFAIDSNGTYVLLHCFTKKTRKTPEREKAKARRELNDYMERRGFYER